MTTDTDTLVALAAQITPGPWRVLRGKFSIQIHSAKHWLATLKCESCPAHEESNARAIALLPELLAETIANRARIEALEAEVERWKSRGDNHWETMRCIYRIATEEGDMQAVIQHIKDAESGYTERPEETLRRYQTELATALTQLTEARAGEDDLAVNLRSIMTAYSEPDRRICCSGAWEQCGCMGATVHQEAEHYAGVALASHVKRKEGR